MNDESIRVLLVGESRRSFFHLAKRLERLQCRCRTATSYPEAKRLIGEEKPDIVLSVVPAHQISVSMISKNLRGSKASFFYGHSVEDGTWWLPALRRGVECLGSPALRAAEFTGKLDELIEAIRQEKSATQTAPEQVADATDPARRTPDRMRKPLLVPQHKLAG